MNETEFINNANEMIEKIATGIDAAGLDCDCGIKGEGILEIEFDDGASTGHFVGARCPDRPALTAGSRGWFQAGRTGGGGPRKA